MIIMMLTSCVVRIANQVSFIDVIMDANCDPEFTIFNYLAS